MQQYFIIYIKIINTADYHLQQLLWQPRHFQQYSAMAHRARVTVELVRQAWQATAEFISPDLWPLNSPDLNPVHYKIWGCLQKRVYRSEAPTRRRWLETRTSGWGIPEVWPGSIRRCFTSSKSRMRFWYSRSNGFRSGLLGGQRSGDMNSGVAYSWRRYSTVTRAGWAGAPYCWKCLGCHGNCCSWYSAVLIIFMVNYKVLSHD